MRFLIVDKHKPSQDFLKQFVSSVSSLPVDCESDGQNVATMCHKKNYDIILLGYDLGEKKNGQQILEDLRVNKFISRQCIVILITGEISQAMVLAALEHKPDEYLCKPYSLKSLIGRLGNCIKKKKTMGPIYAAIQQGDSQLIIDYCDRAIKNNTPYKSECLGIKSRQYFELGQFQQAQDIYTFYKDSKNCQWANIGLGKIALQNNRLTTAEVIFKELIKKNPYYLASYDWLASTYKAQQKFNFAEETLEKALKLSPRSISRLKTYALFCLKNDHYAQAIQAYDKTLKLAKNSVHHSPENTILFAKSLVEYTPNLTLANAKMMNNKAFNYLSQMNKEFQEIELKIHSHMLSACLYHNTQEVYEADIEFNSGEELYVKEEVNIDSEKISKLEGTLHKLEETGRKSAIKIATDESLVQEFDEINNIKRLNDDEIRQRAKLAIERGMKLYQEKKYEKALVLLTKAKELFPEHTSLKLNLLQVILVSSEEPRLKLHLKNKIKPILVELKSIKMTEN